VIETPDIKSLYKITYRAQVRVVIPNEPAKVISKTFLNTKSKIKGDRRSVTGKILPSITVMINDRTGAMNDLVKVASAAPTIVALNLIGTVMHKVANAKTAIAANPVISIFI